MTMIVLPTRMNVAPNSRCNKARSTNAKFPLTADTTLPNGSTSSGGSQRNIEAIELATPRGEVETGFQDEHVHPPNRARVFCGGGVNTGFQVDPTHHSNFSRVSEPSSLQTPKKSKADVMREWRRRNPDKVAEYNERRRIPPTESVCVECGATITGRKDRLLCDQRRCKDQRYQRTHPDEYRAKRRRKDARRRAREYVS
jgi:hypothetical protein